MFILAPAPASLPDCEITPHLLPFALSPTPVTAPVSAYFVPRPAPAAHAFAGSLLAAFRGRQVVGQALDVPRGYRGVVLRAAQVALARPRAVRGRRARVVIQEDDDDDDDEKEDEGGKDRQGRQDGEDGDGEPPAKRRAVMAKPHARVVVRTPAAPVINVPVINIVPSSPVEVNGDEPDDEGEHMARQVDLSCPHAQVDAGPGLMEVAGPEAEAVKDPGRVLVPVARFVRFQGWWRRGGAGEGGDEVVRALGEWLGLNEIIHAPTYPSEDEDEDEGE
ncbi:hypothetical protein CspeluHIS016_0204890 [Cutaneotrichosporon spelunceum]|uniref:Uncharacterized protein n=1 Tax=Cutaneotrichosporon spelunceum TaxID=1672016 RepID=A0AAD3YAV7_9TREE|nr:hypothetical protein CspeluHIS016_0204890 [Cutaneotrichosporon spelunceum]